MKHYLIGLILIASSVYGQNKQYDEYKSNLKKYLEVTNTEQLLELSFDMVLEIMMEGALLFGLKTHLLKSTMQRLILVIMDLL